MKRAEIESFIDSKLDHANTLQALCLLKKITDQRIGNLLNLSNRSKSDKSELKKLFFLQKRMNVVVPSFVADAESEQAYLLLPEYERTDVVRYRYLCSFKLKPRDLSRVEGYPLLVELGYFNAVSNPNGVVKDHRLSIKAGYTSKIDPALMGHPANCEFLTVANNLKKGPTSSISVTDLDLIVRKWNMIDGKRTSRFANVSVAA